MFLKDIVTKYYGNWTVMRPRRCYWSGYTYDVMGIEELRQLEDMKQLTCLNDLGKIVCQLICRWVDYGHEYHLLTKSTNNIYYNLHINTDYPNFGSTLTMWDQLHNFESKLVSNCDNPETSILNGRYCSPYREGEFTYEPKNYEFPSAFDYLWVSYNAQNGDVMKQFEEKLGRPPCDKDFLPLDDQTCPEVTVKPAKQLCYLVDDDSGSDSN